MEPSVLPSLASRGGWGSAAVEEVEVEVVEEGEGSTAMVLTAEWCPRAERTASTGHNTHRRQRNTRSGEHTIGGTPIPGTHTERNTHRNTCSRIRHLL